MLIGAKTAKGRGEGEPVINPKTSKGHCQDQGGDT